MYDRILIPTDGSEVSAAAADAGVRLADRFDAEVFGIHVLEVGELPPEVEDEDADERVRRGQKGIEAVADRATEAGLAVTTAIVEGGGPIHQAVLAYAADEDVDCVVMGTHGRTGVSRFLLGSVTERVVRNTDVPVIAVKEADALEWADTQ